MAMIGKVRGLYFRDRMSVSEIARRTSLSRNTVKRWLKGWDGKEPKHCRTKRPVKMTPYESTVELALKADALRPKRERRTARALFEQIRAQGYAGGYTRMTDFIRDWRAREGAQVIAGFVPLKFALGEAFQFDWSEEGLVVGGVYRRLQVSHMKLCASRAFWLVAYPSQGHEMLFDAHTRSFAAMGGIARRGIFDNMKTAVYKVKKGKGRVVNARFAAMAAHYLFDADFCDVASGWEKGVVEKNVQDSGRRIWIDAREQRFGSFVELNAWLAGRCRALWSEVRHPEHREFSVAEMLEHEQPSLMPMPAPFDGYVENPARVSSTCLVSVQRNRYSVPCEWAGKTVMAHLYPTHLVLVANDAEVARHERCFERGATRYDWQHYIGLAERKPGVLRNGAPFAEMPEALRTLNQGLLLREGGDRAMAQVLAAVPVAGLQAVLSAVDRVIESGVLSAEHVYNMLGRLNAPTPVETVQTSLTIAEPPLADTERYDQLREVGHA